MKRIALIPIDNRPVCYDLPKNIADIDDDIEFFLPPREILGGLNSIADINEIFNWLNNLTNIDIFILSLDTIAYGGLIASRRCEENYDEILIRLEKLKKILQKNNGKTYAFSSIMRISNNNYNEEEKEYWKDYGKKIFDYSYNFHKSEVIKDYDSNQKFSCISNIIPNEILEDYLQTRKRNFEINKIYLDWLKDGLLDTLVYSKDDCAEYGLNVKEGHELQKIIDDKSLKALIKTGADEIPLSLLSKAITQNQIIRIYPIFLRENNKDLISKYEDISVEKSVISQIELCGGIVTDEDNADLILYVNNFEKEQGEWVMGISTKQFDKTFTPSEKPYFIADIAFANGADNNFVDELLYNDIDFEKFYGYSAWNTTGNTLGSLISTALIRYCAKKFNMNNFKKLQIIRFLDDWAYQANCRQNLKSSVNTPDETILKNIMISYENFLNQKFNTEFKNISYNFPWERFFEISVNI